MQPRQQIDFEEINRLALANADYILSRLLPCGKYQRGEYYARNPKRDDRRIGSFAFNTRTGKWADFAVSAKGTGFISLISYLSDQDYLTSARYLSYVLNGNHTSYDFTRTAPKVPKSPKVLPFDRAAIAEKIWKEAIPAERTIAAHYLKQRGYQDTIPGTIRFHRHLFHSPSGTYWPAMVAMVTRWPENRIAGIHRTWLAKDGQAKASISQNKMMLGGCAGGAVRLAEPGRVLIIAEGIETALSVFSATGSPVWAALSTSGIRSLILPPPDHTPEIIIAADNDTAGIAAANASAEAWQRSGHTVKIALPPKGKDFNDVLREASND